MDPKVFYGPLKKPAERPPDSDTETEIEEAPRKFKRLHRRTDSEREPRKRTKDDEPVDISSRAGQRELIRRSSTGDLTFIGRALQLGWKPTPEALVAATRQGHAEVVGMLLAFGPADVQSNNVTPLAVAIQENRAKIVQLLIDANVNLSWRDRLGRSYRELAERADAPVRKILADAYRARRESREGSTSAPTVPAAPAAFTPPETKDHQRRGSRQERKTDEIKYPRKLERQEKVTKPEPKPEPKGVKSAKPDVKPVAKPEPRKTFSLSDYKNLKFTKAKEKEKEKQDSSPVKVIPVNTPDYEAKDKATEAEKSTDTASPDAPVVPAAPTTPIVSAAAPTTTRTETQEERAQRSAREVGDAIKTAAENTLLEVEQFEKSVSTAATVTNEPKKDKASAPQEPRKAKVTFKDPEPRDSSQEPEPARQVSEPLNGDASIDSSISRSSPNISLDTFPSPLSRSAPSRDMSHSPRSPTVQSRAHTPEKSEKRSEERKAFEALLAKRDRERKAREAQMLEKLDIEEKRRKSEKGLPDATVAKQESSPLEPVPGTKSDTSPSTPNGDLPKDQNLTSASNGPQNPPQNGTSNENDTEIKGGEPVPAQITEQIAKFPHILRRLACTGAPQDTGPLFIHRFAGSPSNGMTLESDPTKFYALDVQVGAMFGVCIHSRYPDINKTLMTREEKEQLWQFVSSWVCREGSDSNERVEELFRFRQLPLYWIRGDNVLNIAKDFDIKFKTVPIALGVPKETSTDGSLLELAKSLPVHLAVKQCLRQEVYVWE